MGTEDNSDREMIARLREKGEVLLYLIDIDGFKEVNDRHGHMTGDHLLQVLAKRFRDIQRAGETVARLGGDEFAFVVTGSPETSASHPYVPLAKRIIAQVRMPVPLNRGSVTVGCSIGIAAFPETAGDYLSLLSQADKAMYATKRSGKNGYRKFEQPWRD